MSISPVTFCNTHQTTLERTPVPVMVRWRDSTQPASEWQWRKSLKLGREAVEVVTVALAMHVTPQTLTLAMSWVESDRKRTQQVAGVMRIPMCAIESIVELAL